MGMGMGNNRILIVEDEESLLKLESILLSAKGYIVTGVMDGRSALKEISVNKPDLIVLDIMLPGMDGYEVCKLIKKNPETADIPVVILTARKSSQDYDRGREVCADAFITKPFKSALVIEAIEGLLNREQNGI
jgi:twitching motility two-component system response regulator PilG